MKECYISVDIETTGPVPGDTQEFSGEYVCTYSLLEIGAVVIDEPSQEFFVKLVLPFWMDSDPAAIAAIGLTENELGKKYGRESADCQYKFMAIPRFADWVRTVCPDKTPIFVANNAPFDWMFICHEFRRWNKGVNPFGHSALDMKAYFMGMTGCAWKDSTLKNMAKHVGLKFTKLPHHALEDAKIQGEIFRLLLEKRKPS